MSSRRALGRVRLLLGCSWRVPLLQRADRFRTRLQVRYWRNTSWGRKEIFLSRDIDDATRAGASVESCRFVVPEVSWSRLGSVLVACKRLRRTRGRSHERLTIDRWARARSPQSFGSRALGSPKHYRMRCRRLPDPRPTPRDVQEPISPRKKCAIWTRWRLVPGKNANYPRAPKNRNSGLVGPHTTPPIFNYKYMTSTL